MTGEDKAREVTILVAVGKLYPEQATMLTKELKQRPKQLFNLSVNAVDLFVNGVEGMLKENERELIINITDDFHAVFNELRKKV